jgi:DNA-binding GntR family transcriptional regulator
MDNLPITSEYPSLNRLDLTEQTYHILREWILKRQIQPGEKVSVEAIASGLGVSRTPVVNALKLLEGDGLVEIQPRRGTFVTEVTARDIAELFEIRLMIELHAADVLFEKCDISQFLEDIRPTLERMQAAISEDEYMDYDAFIGSDRDLHTRLVEVLDNRRLINIYQELNVHMRVARAHYLNTVENAMQAQKEHEAMINAIQRKDLDALKEALRSHISNVTTRIKGLLEERGGRL